MNPIVEQQLLCTRRQFFGSSGLRLGGLAMAMMAGRAAAIERPAVGERMHAGLPELPHFAPKAKAIIYLHMNGGPAQMDLWDHKPQLQRYFDQQLQSRLTPSGFWSFSASMSPSSTSTCLSGQARRLRPCSRTDSRLCGPSLFRPMLRWDLAARSSETCSSFKSQCSWTPSGSSSTRSSASKQALPLYAGGRTRLSSTGRIGLEPTGPKDEGRHSSLP